MLNVGTEFRNGILFIRLKGHLNRETIEKYNKRVTNLIKENGIRNIVFNFTNLKSIDIKGINAIFYNYELCKNNEGMSMFCGNNEKIKQKLKRSRLNSYVYEVKDELNAMRILNLR